MSSLAGIKERIAVRLGEDGLEPELREIIKRVETQLDQAIALKDAFDKRSEEIKTKRLVVLDGIQVAGSLHVQGKTRIEGELKAANVDGMLASLAASVAKELNSNATFRQQVKGSAGDRGGKGPNGDKGLRGDKGPQGDKGPVGDKGRDGDNA